MALNRAQLVMGNSSQGVVLPGQIQGVTQGTGVSIAANGAISFDSTSATGVLKTNNPTAYNTYVWPTTIGAAGQQLQLGAGGALSWEDPGGILWTAKGQLIVGTGLATSTILNVGSNGSILIADSSTTSGLNYTANFVATTGPTSAAILPAGNTGARPLTPPAGAFRYNSTSTNLEFFNGASWEIVASSISNDFVEKTSDTGIALIPAGTSAQRPVASTYAGGFRFNSDLDTIEFSDGVAWKQLVMLNNLTGYNAYVWPNADGAYGSFLQTDAAGNLSWENPAFVGTTAPTPASDGMLWYDCNVGYLKVYQSCVAPNGWTKVAEPGLPILTANMSASPAFSSGSGTSGSPYVVTTSTVAPGDSILIPNTITVTGLAPNQYVTIVDQNAVTNGGRYHFTNNFANSAGTLVFNIIFTDTPDSAGGTNYTALIRVGYATGYIQSDVGVANPLSISSPGSISGTAAGGSTLTYTTGSATGGTSPYTYAWVWKKASDDSVLQTNGATYVIPGSLIGDRIYVTLTATDSVSATASGDTTDYPGAPAVIVGAPFPNWAVAAPTTIPGITSGSWSDGTTSITSTNCIQISLDGTNFNQGPLSVSNGTTLYMQWEQTGASCGGAPSGTTITGTITNGTFTNSYSLTLDRNPDNFTFTDLTGQALSTAITSNIITISGTNSPAYITGTSATLTSVQVSVAGGAFVSLPTSGTTVTVNPGATVQIKGTTGASSGTGYSVTVNMGTTSDTWTVTTSAAVPTVAQPSITSPVDGATGINAGVNCTPGVILVASAFSSSNGAGTNHASSDWQVATDSGFSTIVFSSLGNTTNLTSISVPRANLVVSTTYYCRVRYTSGTAGGGVVTTSAYSSSTYDWVTNSSFIPPIGTAMCGGYFAGQTNLNGSGTIYNLIVAPNASGFKISGSLPYKTSNTADPAVADGKGDGYTITTALNDADHPAFQWAKSLNIGGYTDWYIPAYWEFNTIIFFLKGSFNTNGSFYLVNNSSNPYSVSPQTNAAWTAASPAQTTATNFLWLNTFGPDPSNESFQFGGANFPSYGSSTQTSPDASQVEAYNPGGAGPFPDGLGAAGINGYLKTAQLNWRAVRKFAA